jgi:anti-anti-sigma factor
MPVKRRSHLHLVQAAVKHGRRREPPGFELQQLSSGKRYTLVLRGELDLASAPSLARALAHVPMDSSTSVVLDLRAVTFIDSTGVCAMLVIHALCAERGCGFSIVPGGKQVERVFELCGLLDYLPFREDRVAERRGPPSGSLQDGGSR